MICCNYKTTMVVHPKAVTLNKWAQYVAYNFYEHLKSPSLDTSLMPSQSVHQISFLLRDWSFADTLTHGWLVSDRAHSDPQMILTGSLAVITCLLNLWGAQILLITMCGKPNAITYLPTRRSSVLWKQITVNEQRLLTYFSEVT